MPEAMVEVRSCMERPFDDVLTSLKGVRERESNRERERERESNGVIERVIERVIE